MITDKIPQLFTYNNGKFDVAIYADGTKVRTLVDHTQSLYQPESIDVKITNYCTVGCPYCSESSTVEGKHCDADLLLKRLDGLKPGTELAIGGGNPLDHPHIFKILSTLKGRGYICSLTVNSITLRDTKYRNIIDKLALHNLIYGLGISCSTPIQQIESLYYQLHGKLRQRMVPHVIAGVHPFEYIQEILTKYKKVLILGYKYLGRGVVFYEANDFPIQKIEYLRNNVWKLFKYGDLIFDELAISQLEIERQIPKQWWNDYYMGDYGEFTMFYDVVEDQYALSSTHRRKPAAQYSSLCSYFLWESR